MSFSGLGVSLDQRSSLNLTPGPVLNAKSDLDLQFHISFKPSFGAYYGYIFRLLVGDQNIDLIHGIIPGNRNNFELILGKHTSKIAFHIPVEELLNEWIHLRIQIDTRNERILFYIKDTIYEDSLTGYALGDGVRLMFGAHSYGKFSSTDVPAMIIRDIELMLDKGRIIRWPLNDMEGTVAHSVPQGNDGIAFNPGWILKQHNTWIPLIHFEKEGEILNAIDRKNDRIYIVSEDSLFIFDLSSLSMDRLAHSSPELIKIFHSLIYDTITDQLLLYSINDNYLSAFDFNTAGWKDFEPGPVTFFWQHNSLYAPDGRFYIFGGYGQWTYKNSILTWDPLNSRFVSVKYTGDFSPRYLAGSGINPADSLLYFIGGFGSESGKQSEGPDYYYEIIGYSIKDKTFRKVTEFSGLERGFCFAKSVVFDDDNNLYGLSFPKFQFSNQLQLIKVSLDNPEIIELGNPIPYRFHDVSSFSDLHFSEKLNSLIAVISNTSDGTSRLSISSISFPPQTFSIDKIQPERKNSSTAIIIGGSFFILLTLLFLYLRRRNNMSTVMLDDARTASDLYQSRKNSISLFGGFRVIDKEGNEITRNFTPLPKKFFLFILLHSLRDDKGISTSLLSDTFWLDKSTKSARNNRAVNIAKIKAVLENLTSTSISKDTGYWKFDFNPSQFNIDYYDYLRIVRSPNTLSRTDIEKLLSIVENKPFLLNTHEDWLDPFKSDVSNEIIDTFLDYFKRSKDDPEFLLQLTNCIFIVDPVSEEALKLKCRLLIKQGKHGLAKRAYSEFTKAYKQLYNEAYQLSFKRIIEEEL